MSNSLNLAQMADLERRAEIFAIGKKELRVACKEYGVKNYGNLTNDGMRTALLNIFAAMFPAVEAVEPAAPVEEVVEVVEVVEPVAPVRNIFGSLVTQTLGQAVPVATVQPGTRFVDGRAVGAANKTKTESRAKAERPPVVRASRKGYSIQKDRQQRNGVKRPSEGTICATLWAYFDANPETKAAQLGDISDANVWDRTTVGCQFYAWRKFNGIKGRAAK